MRFLRRFHLNSPIGNKGEDLAAAFLRGQGFSIVERNYKNCRGRAVGEIDIVAKEGKELVFVEVKAKTAKGGETILPEENITREKLRKLSRIAEGYLRERRLEDAPYRFDAVLIVFRDANDPEIRHFRGIFL